ncbi:hypothetical protein WJX81_002677 [Elliptochloris bilobata]|uniref:Uncharacterized protein n=1 Tax=Elliptochloris bilobata TaxID=381761 RepID=A0AAW1QXV7_9CHLO
MASSSVAGRLGQGRKDRLGCEASLAGSVKHDVPWRLSTLPHVFCQPWLQHLAGALRTHGTVCERRHSVERERCTAARDSATPAVGGD